MSEPYSEPMPPYLPRVAVKFYDWAEFPDYLDEPEQFFDDDERARWDDLRSRFPGLSIERQFTSLSPGQLRELMQRAAALSPDYTPPNLLTHYAIICRDADPQAVVEELRTWPRVEAVYDEGAPVEPPTVTVDDPRVDLQGYLGPARTGPPGGGIGALAVWDNAAPGGAGETIGFIDIEQGWRLDHEDLPQPALTPDGENRAYFDHGTSALGVVLAVDNAVGCIGIACNAAGQVVSEWRAPSDVNRKTADAIAAAAAKLGPGDVLLLESQYAPPGSPYLPSETQRAVYDAVEIASRSQIVVVEPAGNGGIDLSQITVFEDNQLKQVFNRSSPSFRDSGAIMVGAASSADLRRHPLSNFGGRVNCFAWGDEVDTLLASSASAYTDGPTKFGGTSSAAAIVAGAAILVQSLTWHQRGARLSARELRARLSSRVRNTRSASPASDRIGVMPNLAPLVG